MLLRIALSGFHKKGLEPGELLTRHLDGPRRIDGVKTLFEGLGTRWRRCSTEPQRRRSSGEQPLIQRQHHDQARAHEVEVYAGP